MQFTVFYMCLSASGVVALHRVTHRITENCDVIQTLDIKHTFAQVVSSWIEP